VSIHGDSCHDFLTFLVFSCYGKHIATFLNKEGVELFQIGKDKTGSFTFDTLCIKEDNSVAVSSGLDSKRCITIIGIESKKVSFRLRCILSTDIGGRSATIIWACLSFFLTKVNSKGLIQQLLPQSFECWWLSSSD
jgi:hypothetical protein